MNECAMLVGGEIKPLVWQAVLSSVFYATLDAKYLMKLRMTNLNLTVSLLGPTTVSPRNRIGLLQLSDFVDLDNRNDVIAI